jgi:hypothetical protein
MERMRDAGVEVLIEADDAPPASAEAPAPGSDH